MYVHVKVSAISFCILNLKYFFSTMREICLKAKHSAPTGTSSENYTPESYTISQLLTGYLINVKHEGTHVST